MSKTITVENLIKLLPPSLLKNKQYRALAIAIAKELYRIYLESYKVIIYAEIDKLDEKVLDVLAVDFNVAWYDPNYPIEVKREMIKSNVTVHKKMGTKKAVEKALDSLHPYTKIEEWYEYEGDPFYFRVILETTKSRVLAEFAEIAKTIEYYKRESAVLDGIVYQNSINLEAVTSLETYVYYTNLTGQSKTGTLPKRSSIFSGLDNNIEVGTRAELGAYISKITGTIPYRNTGVEFSDEEAVISIERDSKIYSVDMTGTNPETSSKPSEESCRINSNIQAEGYIFNNNLCGQSICGKRR